MYRTIRVRYNAHAIENRKSVCACMFLYPYRAIKLYLRCILIAHAASNYTFRRRYPRKPRKQVYLYAGFPTIQRLVTVQWIRCWYFYSIQSTTSLVLRQWANADASFQTATASPGRLGARTFGKNIRLFSSLSSRVYPKLGKLVFSRHIYQRENLKLFFYHRLANPVFCFRLRRSSDFEVIFSQQYRSSGEWVVLDSSSTFTDFRRDLEDRSRSATFADPIEEQMIRRIGGGLSISNRRRHLYTNWTSWNSFSSVDTMVTWPFDIWNAVFMSKKSWRYFRVTNRPVV